MTNHQQINRIKIRVLRITLLFSILLMGIKFIAYFITNSVAVLSDALESIVNVVAGGFALFSIYYAVQPRDKDHPYGRGKIENISAGFEGALIFIAGIFIIGEAIDAFFNPPELEKLDLGLLLSGFAGLCNYLAGTYLVRKGKRYNSLIMIADGKHLVSDTISSVGLILGLGIIYLTGALWIDNILAIIFGSAILFTGFKLIREAVFNLLDKTDLEMLEKLIIILNQHRKPKWIDIHNLRILKYGSRLHVDAHLTLPWYGSLEESHHEVSTVERILQENLESEIEFFIHADPCVPGSCPVCTLENCPQRKHPLLKKVDWTVENLLPDAKHKIINLQ